MVAVDPKGTFAMRPIVLLFTALCLCASSVFAEYGKPTPPRACPPGCNTCPAPVVDDGGWHAPAPLPGPIFDTEASQGTGYLLPGRERMAKEFADAVDKERQAREQDTAKLLNAINGLQRQGQQDIKPEPPLPTPPEAKPTEDEGTGESKMKTKYGEWTYKEAQWFAAHGTPLQKILAKHAIDNMEDDSAAVRFKGFTQAKVLVLMAGLLFFALFCVGLWLLHRLNNKLIPKLQEIAAKTPGTLDDKLVELLAKVHGRVDTLESKIPIIGKLDEKIADAKAKAESALHIGTAAALATNPVTAPLAGAAAVKAAVDAVHAVTV